MHRFAVVIAAATVLIAGAPIMGTSAGAAPMVAPGALRGAADSLNMVERAQFVWLGHNYCWYDDGWNGPGWYWCGQYLTSGIGWGGGYGWHHWHGGHPGGRGGHAGHPHAAVVHGGHGPAAVVHGGHAHAAVSRGGGGGHGGGHGGGGHGGGGHGGGGHGKH